ncbi:MULTISPECIES: PPC domain-containing DNA-binding protein [Clostridium]|uniref:PPC domain-containing DNA-binding protein n=1 Tax=Clostridium TaxID=1485 RepID=UPI00189A69CE|nr:MULTISPECIES: PPC domain-containing DNA-binding protein [Clostridium]MCR1950802.1 DNA-binding protein [Clostridium sp. DSM 100503]MDI9216642.1 DNA-binding protein [Clostridium tertium]
MDYRVFDERIVLRLEKGEEVIESIKKVCEEQKIIAGSISGLGATNHVVVGLFKPNEKKYYSSTYEDDFEITNITGNISVMDEEVYLHIHGTFANLEGKCIGGHLNKAVISATAEIIINRINGAIGRKFDENIGLNLIEF